MMTVTRMGAIAVHTARGDQRPSEVCAGELMGGESTAATASVPRPSRRARAREWRPPPISGDAVRHRAERCARGTCIAHLGEPVWVSGVLVYERAGEHGYRDRPVTMRLVGKPGQPLALGRARRVPQVGR